MPARLIEGRLVRLAGKLQRERQIMLSTNLKTDHVMRRCTRDDKHTGKIRAKITVGDKEALLLYELGRFYDTRV